MATNSYGLGVLPEVIIWTTVESDVERSLRGAIGKDLNGSYGTVPGTDSPGAAKFSDMAKAAGFKAGPFSSESYDAAALIMLAMQAAKSSSSKALKGKVMMVVRQTP